MINNIIFIEIDDIYGIRTIINVESILMLRENISLCPRDSRFDKCNEIVCKGNTHIYTNEPIPNIIDRMKDAVDQAN